MKYVRFIILTGLLFSCESDFNPNTTSEPIPVVYCLLDLNDSIQEVRLAKTFSPDRNALEQLPIKLEGWHEPANIYVEEYISGEEFNTYFFTLRTQVISQDSGLFQSPSFQIYESTFKPKPDTHYNLYVFLEDSDIHCYATTKTISAPRVIDPASIPGRKISFSQYDDYLIHFYPPKNSAYHECYFQFDNWTFGRQLTQEPKEQGTFVNLSSERFFKTLPPSGTFERSEFHIISYGQEMGLYNHLFLQTNEPWENQSYSSFLNGIGLFSSRIHQRISNLATSDVTLKLIQEGYQFEARDQNDVDLLNNNGIFEFNFTLPASVLPADKIHRLELNLAYNADSLYKSKYFATINVSDSRDQYYFTLPPGDYYYIAGITCSCQADSCLWDGYPDGQFGARYASDRFTIQKGEVTTDSPSFQ
ncbi:MAG: DUF4249 family protein [Bacteroidales bacterium]|nr:DUF4249 family protein [Bacteroidales bacterium]